MALSSLDDKGVKPTGEDLTRVLEQSEEAPRYGEGTGFRIPVTSVGDCADIEIVIDAKMS